MTERTYLRIHRRRNAVSALMIQLDGVHQDESSSLDLEQLRLEQASSLQAKQQRHHQRQSPPPPKKAKTMIWRRISSSECLLSSKKRDFRVVDAILDEEDDAPEQERQKRRRLTLVEGGADTARTCRSSISSLKSRKNNKKISYKILNPCERLVDDSLQQVFSGATSVVQHYALCNTDPRLCQASHKWFSWYNVEHGNLLHACALWNEVSMANELLSRDLVSLVDAIDGDGRTPKDVAELCGHSLIVDLLQQFYIADNEDYVFDLYCLDGEAPSEDVVGNTTTAPPPLDCELHGGIGYWDEHGQLVLNLLPRSMSEVSVADDDELDDSNREDWNGNDYPDEGDSGESLSCDEEQVEEVNFRQRPVHLGHAFDIDDDDGDFDAAYGIYSQKEPEYGFEA